MNKSTSKALLLQFRKHSVNVSSGHIGVPHPQRGAAELTGRIGKLFLQRLKAQFSLLFLLLTSQAYQHGKDKGKKCLSHIFNYRSESSYNIYIN